MSLSPGRVILAAALASSLLTGQNAPGPAFEVASIRPTQQTGAQALRMGSSRLGVHIEGDRVNVGFVTVYDMIRVAYRAKSYQLVDESFLLGNSSQTAGWRVEGPGAGPDSLTSDVAKSVQQLGLRLEARKVPVEKIIVDHVEKTPTEN